MTHRSNDHAHADGAGETSSKALRHPLRTAEHEVEHLMEIAKEGESAATPAILTVTWIVIVLPLVAIVVGLAFGVAYLVTGSAGTRYPSAPAGRPLQGGSAAGETIFASNCSPCHGPTGHGGIGPDLTTLPAARNIAVVVHQVTYGGGGMPSFKAMLDQQQIHEVAAYVSGVIAQRRS